VINQGRREVTVVVVEVETVEDVPMFVMHSKKEIAAMVTAVVSVILMNNQQKLHRPLPT